jgi:hypothetical protein
MESHNSAFDQLDALLAQGKITDDEYRDLWNALKGPRAEAPAETEKEGSFRRFCRAPWRVPSAADQKAQFDIWVVAQVFGLGALVAGHAMLCVLSGGASLGLYILYPREKRFTRMVALAAAIVAAIAVGIDWRIDAHQRRVTAVATHSMLVQSDGTQPWQIDGSPESGSGLVTPQPHLGRPYAVTPGQPRPYAPAASAAPAVESTSAQTSASGSAPMQGN